MKLLKKSFALLLALLLVLALGTTAFAGEESANTYSITINSATGKYTAYQIFAGDLSVKDNTKTLSNVTWGSGVEEFAYNDKTVAADIAASLENADAAAADAFAAEAAKHVTGTGTSATASSGTATISGLQAGYYVVINSEVGTQGSYSKYMVQVVGDVTVDSKSDVPSFEKKVKDTNDSTGATSDWQDSADYDIGDAVPFKLTGTVASNYADYKTYYFAFHDKEEKGLTFNKDSVKVSIDGTEVNSGYTIVTAGLTDGCTFHVVFSDLKKTAAKAGSKITVEYTSTLNDSAVLGSTGNVNKAKLQFSNNPNSDQGGESGPTGETPWDNVIVFTYKVVVNKYANSVAEDNKLNGAGFTLYKNIKNGSTTEKTKIAEIIGTDSSVFTFKGLDDGEYILSETKTPAGYNTIKDITFTVVADHTITWGSEARTELLTSLSGNAASGEITFAADKSEGSLSTNVINKSGSTLPSTGGMGTTLFYVLGGLLVVGAGVVLITKKRMSTTED